MLLRSPDENSKVSTGLDNMEATSDLHKLWSGQVGAGAEREGKIASRFFKDYR